MYIENDLKNLAIVIALFASVFTMLTMFLMTPTGMYLFYYVIYFFEAIV